jgi:lipopolysaccharide export system protein LptA
MYRDIDVRSHAAEVLGAEKRAVFTGDVHLTQRGRRLTTEKVTVWYGEGRVVAEGQTWIRVEPQP